MVGDLRLILGDGGGEDEEENKEENEDEQEEEEENKTERERVSCREWNQNRKRGLTGSQ